MSPADSVGSESLAILRREFEQLYSMQAEQAARLAALEGEVFTLKRLLSKSRPLEGIGQQKPTQRTSSIE